VSKGKRRAVVSVAAVAVALLAVGLTLGFTGGSGQASDVSYIGGSTSALLYKAGHRSAAPDFTGHTLTGALLRFASYRRGKVVVLNFWGSWCVPCRSEGPMLAVLSEQYSPDGVAFLGDDVGDTPANALAFTHGIGITYPSVNDPGYQVAQDFSKAVLVNDTPTTLVIDRTGHIAGVIYGTATYSELNTLIKDVAVTR
jgi:thiol-disulfide isomerase/thioredoxin